MTRVSFLASKFEQVPYYNTMDIWQLDRKFRRIIQGYDKGAWIKVEIFLFSFKLIFWLKFVTFFR